MSFYNDQAPISDNKSADSSFYAVSGDQISGDEYTSLVDYGQKLLANVTALKDQTNGFLVEARIASQDALTILQNVLQQSQEAQDALQEVVGILDEANDTIADYQAIQAAVALSVDENENLQLLINADANQVAVDRAAVAGYKADTETALASATGAANNANSAASDAGISAGVATNQAAIATSQASAASSSANAAEVARLATIATKSAIDQAAAQVATDKTSVSTNAGIASSGANTATTQAGIATTQAGIATGAASSAQSSATTATTQSTAAQAARVDAQNFALSSQTAYLNTIANAVPLGSTFWFDCNRAAIPDGYAPKDGQLALRADYPDLWIKIDRGDFPVTTEAQWWDNTTIDRRGYYTRGTNSTNFRFPDNNGKQSGSKKPFLRGDGYDTTIGKVVGDAIRNISGSLNAAGATAWQGGTGVFALGGSTSFNAAALTSGTQSGISFSIDTSRQVPTANENRPVFTVGVYVVKARGMTDVSFLPQGVSPATLLANIFNGDQEINGNLSVNGNVTIRDGHLDAFGKIYANSGLEVNWGSTLRNGAEVQGGLNVSSGGATVTGSVVATGGLRGNSVFVQGSTNAGVELNAQSGGITYVDFSPNGSTSDFTVRLAVNSSGNFEVVGTTGTMMYVQQDGNIWTKMGWVNERFATRGAEVQHNSGINEFASCTHGYDDTRDTPSPYVMTGMRTWAGDSMRHYLRAKTLRNN